MEGLLGITTGEVAIMLAIDHTATAGAISLTPAVQIKEPSGGSWIDYWTAAAAIVAQDVHLYLLTQRTDLLNGATVIVAAGKIREVISRPINGAEWRFIMKHGNANSQTYSVGGYRIFQI
jgi:hypothetical protein